MKYIDSEKLIAEIERQIEEDKNNLTEETELYYGARQQVRSKILRIINSLQQEQPEVEFEKAYKSYMKSRKDDLSGNAVTLNMKDLACHFAEWGAIHLNARKEE